MKSILQIIFIAGLLILQSCKKESNDIFNQDYFYYTFEKNDPAAFSIPINEIVCDPLISNSQFHELISYYDLTIINSEPDFPYYLLKINKIVTGFEPLNVANSLYRTNKFNYCTPNFFSSFAPN